MVRDRPDPGGDDYDDAGDVIEAALGVLDDYPGVVIDDGVDEVRATDSAEIWEGPEDRPGIRVDGAGVHPEDVEEIRPLEDADGKEIATDGGPYTASRSSISAVAGLEIDIDVRNVGRGDSDADKVLMDLLERAARLGAAFSEQTPPDEIDEIPEDHVPLFVPDWEQRFDDEDGEENQGETA